MLGKKYAYHVMKFDILSYLVEKTGMGAYQSSVVSQA